MNQTVCPVTGFTIVEGLMGGYCVKGKECGPVNSFPWFRSSLTHRRNVHSVFVLAVCWLSWPE